MARGLRFYRPVITRERTEPMAERIVLAIGGNALLTASDAQTFDQQLDNARRIADQVVDVVAEGTEVVITHGNGPQVGHGLLRNETADDDTPRLPLFALGAESQGFIGAVLLLALEEQLADCELKTHTIPILTSIIVDEESATEPTKPVGPFYNEREAVERRRQDDETYVKDAGRGWRRVVPSPEPMTVPQAGSIERIVESGDIPITLGGGGLPVVPDAAGYQYIDGVVDKDLAAAQLAVQIDADKLVILTDVSHVALNFGTKKELPLETIDCETMREYQNEGHFQRGSMYEKVESVCRFIESGVGNEAIITDLNKCRDALTGTTGTAVYPISSLKPSDNYN